MDKKSRILFFIIDIVFIAALVFFDQYTKMLATVHLMGKPAYPLIPGVLVLQYLEGGNQGGAFGIFYGQRLFFIAVASVFLVLMLIALIRIPAIRKYRILRFFICMICAGAVGNLVDRISSGSVVDFIYIIYINFPIFNVADIYVTLSSLGLAVLILFVYKEDDLNMKKANDPRLHYHSSMIKDDNG